MLVPVSPARILQAIGARPVDIGLRAHRVTELIK
jgi:hypothetical protein